MVRVSQAARYEDASVGQPRSNMETSRGRHRIDTAPTVGPGMIDLSSNRIRPIQCRPRSSSDEHAAVAEHCRSVAPSRLGHVVRRCPPARSGVMDLRGFLRRIVFPIPGRESAGHQDSSVRQQRRGMEIAGRRHARGGTPASAGGIEYLSRGSRSEGIASTNDQHVAAWKQDRCVPGTWRGQAPSWRPEARRGIVDFYRGRRNDAGRTVCLAAGDQHSTIQQARRCVTRTRDGKLTCGAPGASRFCRGAGL
jgi:hypothetical protein